MIKVIIDSACDNKEIKSEKVIIRPVPLTIDIDDKTYVDDEGLNMPEFLSSMKKMITFKTACPSPTLFEDEYAGDEDIIVLTVSSHLSGSYQAALIARDSYIEKHGNHKQIHVIDSLSASGGQSNILLKIIELAEVNYCVDDIITKTHEFIKQNQTFFILHSLSNLAKAGRVSNIIAAASSALNIRCLMGSDGDGNIILMQKTIGEKRCLKLLAKKIEHFSQNIIDKTLCISHCEAIEKVEALLEELSFLIDIKKYKQIVIQKTNGLSSTYAGVGGIIIGIG